MARPRASFVDPSEPARPHVRYCDHEGCVNEGEFRAPRSRDKLNLYWWFCLEHVRAYNAAWNYYEGMSESEIEADLRKDTVWQRPTWPLGWRLKMRDPLNIIDGDDADGHGGHPHQREMTIEEKALAVFELDPPFTLVELKKRYKLLVKRHHPDANGGDKDSEERLKVINQAFAFVKAKYFA
jgi:DnaJ-domain-containing protein 1